MQPSSTLSSSYIPTNNSLVPLTTDNRPANEQRVAEITIFYLQLNIPINASHILNSLKKNAIVE